MQTLTLKALALQYAELLVNYHSLAICEKAVSHKDMRDAYNAMCNKQNELNAEAQRVAYANY